MQNKSIKAISVGALALIFVGITGCATQGDPRDPIEPWNRGVQKFNDSLDDYVMKPIAEGYQWVTPGFVDQGVSNFFENLDDIAVTVNDVLQFKVKQSGLDASRFAVNTTVGLAGLIDVASRIGLEKHEEDFGQTLAVWGLPNGPYLVVPFLGPMTPRDAVGSVADGFMNPIAYTIMPVRVGLYGLKTTDFRADNLSATEIMDEAALDRYSFIRNAYFQRREYLVYDGEPPLEDDFEDFEDEFFLELEEES
ncbi:MAG: VacJ family lipoprotein [Methylohalobius crimeensis]